MNKFCEKVDACAVNKQARKNRRKNQAVTSLVVKRNEVVKNTVASMFFFAPKMSWGTLLSVERHLLTTTVMAYLILFAIFWHDVTQNFTGFFIEPLNVLVRAPTNVIWNLSSSVIVTVVASFIHFLPLLIKLLIDGSHFIGEQFLDYY